MLYKGVKGQQINKWALEELMNLAQIFLQPGRNIHLIMQDQQNFNAFFITKEYIMPHVVEEFQSGQSIQ